MSEHQTRHGGGAATDHVLVGTADIGGDDLQDDAMFDTTPVRCLEFRIVNVADFHFSGPQVDDATVLAHFRLLR